MKNLKRKIFLSIVVLLCFSITTITYAHPGRTNKYGCHTCKTNCKKWWLYYWQYHCHK
jgi:hypothetical protein